MFGGGFFFEALAVTVVVAALLVAARLLLCGVLAARARHTWIIVISIAGVLGVAALFSALVVMWFIYGVAHTGKDMTTFVRMLLVTGVPYFLGLIGLWFLGGFLASRLRASSKESDAVRNGTQRLD